MKSITKRKTNGGKKISERCKTYPRFFLIDVHSCCESSIRMSFLRRVSTTSRSYSVRCGVTRCMSAAILDAYGGGCKQQPFSSCSLSLSLETFNFLKYISSLGWAHWSVWSLEAIKSYLSRSQLHFILRHLNWLRFFFYNRKRFVRFVFSCKR